MDGFQAMHDGVVEIKLKRKIIDERIFMDGDLISEIFP